MSSTLVLIRHGQSVWNAENRFTGWIDVALAEKGWKEAEKAAELLADYCFDAAYTSHLQRAITTLQVVLRGNRNSKNPLFIPHPGTIPAESYRPGANEYPVYIHVTALAERHYGDLQGLNKDEVRAEYGEEQFKKWRRGFDTPPPNGESLKDTCDRVLPYFRSEIEPNLLQGKQLLVSAHGNSLRALTMHLENLSPEEIVTVEIPTGTPIIYELEYGSGRIQVKNKSVMSL